MSSSSKAGPDVAEFHVWETGDDSGAREAVVRWSPYLIDPVLDVGCGEGLFLTALRTAGLRAEGVDVTPALVDRARARGVIVHGADAARFVAERGSDYRTFVLLDFIEHVPFEAFDAILARVPAGGRVIIQTPNTNSIIGHQFYLQVPSHVAPYSPTVLRGMLRRHHFAALAEGTAYGGLPWRGLRRRITEFLLVKMLGTVTAQMLIEGANYWIVAEKSATAVTSSGGLQAPR